MKMRGKIFSTATREAHRRHQGLLRDLPQHEKVMYRMDRILRERDVRSYQGWAVNGPFCAVLNFDHGTIAINPFGDLQWVPDSAGILVVGFENPAKLHHTLHAVFGE